MSASQSTPDGSSHTKAHRKAQKRPLVPSTAIKLDFVFQIPRMKREEIQLFRATLIRTQIWPALLVHRLLDALKSEIPKLFLHTSGSQENLTVKPGN